MLLVYKQFSEDLTTQRHLWTIPLPPSPTCLTLFNRQESDEPPETVNKVVSQNVVCMRETNSILSFLFTIIWKSFMEFLFRRPSVCLNLRFWWKLSYVGKTVFRFKRIIVIAWCTLLPIALDVAFIFNVDSISMASSLPALHLMAVSQV